MPRRPSPGPDASNTGVLRQIYGIGPAIKDSGVAAATVAPGSGFRRSFAYIFFSGASNYVLKINIARKLP